MPEEHPKHFQVPDGSLIRFGTIDTEHLALIESINRAQDAMVETGLSPEDLWSILSEIRKQFAWHFVSEERLMLKVAYPDLDQHAADHRKILANISERREAVRKGELTGSSLIHTLFASLVDDMLRHDLSFKEYLDGRNLIER